jgi:hypothetical protein
MTVLAVLLLIVICGLLAYLVWRDSDDQSPPLDPEKAMQAALELHRIRRRLEAAECKQRQRSDAARFKRELADALDENTL